MKKIILTTIMAINSIIGISQNDASQIKEEIPFLKGFTTESKLKDFQEKFSNYTFKRKVNTDISSYNFGKIEYNGIDYLCTGHFYKNGKIVLIRFISEIENQPLKQYGAIIKIFDSNLTSFNKISKKPDDIFLQQIIYTKENVEYWASLVSGYGKNKYKSISFGFKVKPLEDIIKTKEFRERLELLKSEYGEKYAPLIMQGMISIGMSKEMIIQSLGEPNITNTSNYKNKVSQQLVYYFSDRTLYVYLEDDVVTSYQENEKMK